ncbi:ASCH domain-containing protein [Patescibacteria group bacterium]|nr:ASCH domain-containing protein [Patescibacteria group bacterium]MBU1901337.1 ASCH domain-containing protein [Patescibacteria group bacterium]
MIVEGTKTVEVRVAYSSLLRIQRGDTVRFLCKQRSCDRRVVRVSKYNNFREMLANEDVQKINPYRSAEQQLRNIRKIFPPNKERLGVLVFQLEEVV